MKMSEAKWLVIKLRFLGWFTVIASSILLAYTITNTIFYRLIDANDKISQSIKSVIALFYYYTGFIPIWKIAPIINDQVLNTSGNWAFLLIILCFMMGFVILNSAFHLKSRIKKTKERVEEAAWFREQSARQGIVTGGTPDMMQIDIMLDQKDQWYKKPTGILLLTVIAAVLAQWLNLKFGLLG